MNDIKITYYNGDIHDPIARGYINLRSFIRAHEYPNKRTVHLIEKINNASKIGDKTLKSNLKKFLYYFTPSVRIPTGKRRRYKNISRFTGLVQLDFDGLESEDVEDLKEYLFNNYKQFYCVYKSPSGMGVKGIMRIPVISMSDGYEKAVNEYKEYFAGIENQFDWIFGFDSAPKNPALPLYLSADKNIMWRKDATVWTEKGILPNVSSYKNLSQDKPNYEPTDGDSSVYKSAAYYEKITLDIFEKRIGEIIDGDGHPRLRSACLVLGSRVGAGYVQYQIADSFAEQCIRANKYLSKGVENYLKTMRWGITEGGKRPKYYE